MVESVASSAGEVAHGLPRRRHLARKFSILTAADRARRLFGCAHPLPGLLNTGFALPALVLLLLYAVLQFLPASHILITVTELCPLARSISSTRVAPSFRPSTHTLNTGRQMGRSVAHPYTCVRVYVRCSPPYPPLLLSHSLWG